MNQQELKDFLHDYIDKAYFATLASVNAEGKPESAVMEIFLMQNDFSIVVRTQKSSRKYKNLQSNAAVALQINGFEPVTVQYEGTAEEIDPAQLDRQDNIIIASRTLGGGHPVYDGVDDDVYFLITPTWIRYTDVSTRPWKKIEYRFDESGVANMVS